MYHPVTAAAALLAAGLAVLLLAFAPAPALAQDSTLSRWGAFPPPADSTTARFVEPGMPVWEAAVYWPYRVVTYPVKLTVDGIGRGVVWADETRVFQKLGEFLSPPPRVIGFTPTFNFGGLQGFGGGITLYNEAFLGPEGRARISADGTTRGSARARLGLHFHEGDPWSVEAGAGYRLRRAVRFFGVGPDAPRVDESFLAQEVTWAGVSVVRRLGDFADVRLIGMATTAGTRRPIKDEAEESIEEVFEGRLPYGYGLRSDGGSLALEFYTGSPRDHRRPTDEGYLRLKAGYFDDWNATSPNFWSFRASGAQHIPLWHTYRSLRLSGVASWMEQRGAGTIPFQRMTGNSDYDVFRGYQDYRWLDRGLALASFEYRWPVWVAKEAANPGIDLFLLSDVGQVFGDADEIAIDNLTASYGFGLEYVGARGMTLRVEVAWSEEENEIRIGAVNLLDVGVGRLFYGRHLVPDR